jgi:hypothetical protein
VDPALLPAGACTRDLPDERRARRLRHRAERPGSTARRRASRARRAEGLLRAVHRRHGRAR